MSQYPHIDGPPIEGDATLAALLEQLQSSYHDAVCATLVYGSCLRSGDIYDGLLDLYLICDNYRTAYQRGIPAVANWVLPPNVYYFEQRAVDGSDRTLRSKVTVISLRDFQRGCSSAWFESYIWGRFAQPTRILYARDDTVRSHIEDALLNAALTLLKNALPATADKGSLNDLWQQALGLSYATELRTERSGRAAELVDWAGSFYAELTRLHAPQLPIEVEQGSAGLSYSSAINPAARRRGQLAWTLRRGLGKLLSIARLVKALFTFVGGLDYIAWKLQRHSGQEVVIPDKVRRAPLLHLWGFFWGLYKRGIFK